MSQSQMEQMSAFGSTPTNLSSQNLTNPKILKDSCSGEDPPQHDSSQESLEGVHHGGAGGSGHHHIHQNIVIVSYMVFVAFLISDLINNFECD